MSLSRISRASLIVFVVCIYGKTTDAHTPHPLRPRLYGDKIQQCPCVIPPGSKKCAAYDSRYQAVTIAEAMISFSDLSLDPRRSDRSSFSDFACQSYECQQCVGALITKFRKIGLLGKTERVGLNVPAIDEFASQCQQLRFVKLPRKFAEPNLVPDFMRDMIRQGLVHWRNRRGGGGRSRNSKNRRRGQQPRARPRPTASVTEKGGKLSGSPGPASTRQLPQQGSPPPRNPGQRLPNRRNKNRGGRRNSQPQNRRVKPGNRGRQGRPQRPESGPHRNIPNNNEQSGNGDGWNQRQSPRPGGTNGDQNGQTGAQFPNANRGDQLPSGNWNIPNENANNGGNGPLPNGQQPPGGWNPNFSSGSEIGGGLPNAAQQFIGGIVKKIGEQNERGQQNWNENYWRGNQQSWNEDNWRRNQEGNFQGRHSHEHAGGGFDRGGQEGYNQFGHGWSNGHHGNGNGHTGFGGPRGEGGGHWGGGHWDGGHLGGGHLGGGHLGGGHLGGGHLGGGHLGGGHLGGGHGGGGQHGWQMGVGGGPPGNLNGGIGFGAHARERRAVPQNSNGFIGTRSTVMCAEKGTVDPFDHQKNDIGLCSVCWVIRTLPENYSPRFINELICSGSDRQCLAGWGNCEQKTRPLMFNRFDRQVNGTVVVTQVQIQAGMCCDCQVQAGSSMFAMVVGKAK